MDIKNIDDNNQLLGTLRILYVEDDEEALTELAYFLKKRVASLSTALNGVEALKLVKRKTFDAVICDLWMPEMDGLTFIKSIRDEGLKIPVVITSAFSDIDTILKAVDLDIVKYCVKPIDPDELLTCLNRIALQKLSQSGEFITANSELIDREKRLELEKKLKSSFAHLLKNLTGKGPKKVHISISANDVEIWATGVLSPIEISLSMKEKHAGIVPYIRKAIYTSYSDDFELLVSETLGRSAKLEDIRNEIEEDTDWIIFKLN